MTVAQSEKKRSVSLSLSTQSIFGHSSNSFSLSLSLSLLAMTTPILTCNCIDSTSTDKDELRVRIINNITATFGEHGTKIIPNYIAIDELFEHVMAFIRPGMDNEHTLRTNVHEAWTFANNKRKLSISDDKTSTESKVPMNPMNTIIDQLTIHLNEKDYLKFVCNKRVDSSTFTTRDRELILGHCLMELTIEAFKNTPSDYVDRVTMIKQYDATNDELIKLIPNTTQRNEILSIERKKLYEAQLRLNDTKEENVITKIGINSNGSKKPTGSFMIISKYTIGINESHELTIFDDNKRPILVRCCGVTNNFSILD